MELPGQKFGNTALGAAVVRHFPDEGKFTGTIVGFRKLASTSIYTVQYADGDVEDLEDEEYNAAYELWLRESGWLPAALDVKPTSLVKPTKITKASRGQVEAVIDLTAASSIAGKHIQSMDEGSRSAVIELAQKHHRKLENKNVKAAVLEVQYATLCQDAFVKHLRAKVTPPLAMQHARRPTLMENQAILAKLKIGDWVFATEDMSPGKNSEGGMAALPLCMSERELETLNLL
jgi:hypothetical protein